MPSRKAFSYEEKVSPQATDEVAIGATRASLPTPKVCHSERSEESQLTATVVGEGFHALPKNKLTMMIREEQ